MPNKVRTKGARTVVGFSLNGTSSGRATCTNILRHLIIRTLEEGYPNEFEGREDNWAWLCSHFQEPSYVKKVKANKSNRDKRLFSTISGGSKFPDIDVFSDVYVQPGDKLAESLHTSEPLQPEHGHTFTPSTSEPNDNLKTFQSPPHDDHVDYATLFS
ncbi:hypothetical protein C1H46_024484 [Malus baccata]|uniref:Uncharacterized protein n=1 Tax=Malus baccata TaxID=106549 RepID=A0A540LUC5_MALBA|nr:hypothetical protein C1H46_024484 [Malus baccata]